MLANLLFIGFTLFAVGGAIGLILFKHPLNGALSFIITLLSLAGFYAMLNAKTVMLMQIIVYAGAIMILMVFVIMYLNVTNKDLLTEKKTPAIIGTTALLSPLFYFSIKAISSSDIQNKALPENFGEIKEVGTQLFGSWMLPFELISILLLVAVVGVIVLAQMRRDNVSC